MGVVLVGVSADGRGAGGVVLVGVSALEVVLVEVVLSKCIGGGVDGGCADGGGAGWSKSIGGGAVVLKIDHHSSNDCFAGTLVLCRAGDRAADGVSFLSIFGRGFCGGSFHAFASGGVFVADGGVLMEVVLMEVA